MRKFWWALVIYVLTLIIVGISLGTVGVYVMIMFSWALIPVMLGLVTILCFLGIPLLGLWTDLFGSKEDKESWYGFSTTVSSATLAEQIQSQEDWERWHRGDDPIVRGERGIRYYGTPIGTKRQQAHSSSDESR